MSIEDKTAMVRAALSNYVSVLGAWSENFKRSIEDEELYDENVFYAVLEQYTITCVRDATPTSTRQ